MRHSTNLEIFKKVDFSLPKTRKEKDYASFLKRTFENYQLNLKTFTGPLGDDLSKIHDRILKLCDAILNAVEDYFNGNIIKAYHTFEKGLDPIKNYLSYSRGVTDFESLRSPEEFYRARVGEYRLFSKKEMFHIPFEKRSLVSLQRYSLPGLPCIYLSNSTYLCWEELGRPDFNKLQFSRFDLSKAKFKFLNLNHTSEAIAITGFDIDGDMNIHSSHFVINYLATWPLQAAVSVIVKDKDMPFKPEYVIPQLLLQWVKNTSDIDGIRYFSTRAVGTTNPIMFLGNLANLVIPIKQTKLDGLCDTLVKKIYLTNPISYEYTSLINPQITLDKLDEVGILSNISMKPYLLNITSEFTEHYVNTKFGQLERVLSNAKATRVSK